MEINKKCEVCGRLLPESEFSKSYKHRCKKCVAKQTKEKRDNAKYGRIDKIFDEYFSQKPRPKKEVITNQCRSRCPEGRNRDHNPIREDDWESA